MPTVSRVRRALIEPELDIPTAEEAWAAVQTKQAEVHPLVRRICTLMGGSYNIRTSEDPELTRVRFFKAYEPMHRKEVDQALAAGIRAARMKLSQAS